MNINLTSYTETFFLVMLGFFTLASATIALMTVLNVLRLKNVRLKWNGGKLKGYPLFSTAFLGFILLAGMASWLFDAYGEAVILASYTLFGLSWFATSFFMSKRYITDHGIVKNINDPSQTLAWHQIRDFVEHEEHGACVFTFFYMVDKGTDRKTNHKTVRLRLEIPEKHRGQFRRIVTYKLGRRFDYFHAPGIEIKQIP